jgi:peptidylprolyl isomerase
VNTKSLLLIPASIALAATVLVACSEESPDVSGDWAVSDCAVLTDPVIEANPPEGSVEEGPVAVAGSREQAPLIGIAAAASPATELITVDLIEGAGTAVAPGDEVTVAYCGVGLASRTIFDSSWARGDTITFPLAGVIAGWQEGMPGMKPGGRRLLVIPADLAYGDTPPPGSGIEAGETLVFVVDLAQG